MIRSAHVFFDVLQWSVTYASFIAWSIEPVFPNGVPDLVWRGVAQGTLNEKNSQKNMQMVDKAVVKVFKKYPR
jgi:hypothetical protein